MEKNHLLLNGINKENKNKRFGNQCQEQFKTLIKVKFLIKIFFFA